MEQNMGTADRIIRSAAAVGAGTLIATGTIKGKAIIALGGLAIFFSINQFGGPLPRICRCWFKYLNGS